MRAPVKARGPPCRDLKMPGREAGEELGKGRLSISYMPIDIKN